MKIELMPTPEEGFNWLYRSCCWARAGWYKNWDPMELRFDVNGRPIRYEDFGNSDSPLGWGIGYKVSPSQGGKVELRNMMPIWCGSLDASPDSQI